MGAETLPRDGQLMRNRSLVLFWGARGASTVAFQMLGVAVGWQIYALTGSPVYLGLVGLAQFLPMFLLTLVVGHAADRYDRRLIVLICQCVQSGGAVALAWGSFEGWLSSKTILAIVFVIGAARSFEMPTTHALLPNLVSPVLFTRAVASSTSVAQTAVILGPALGGFLYTAGPTTAYSAIGLSFLGAGLSISLIRIPRSVAKTDRATMKSVLAGIVFIRSKPAILGAISLDLFAVLLGGATALLPVYAREILAVGPWGLGFLRSAPALGALSMSLFLARYPLRHRMGHTMFFAVIIFGVSTVIFALSRSFVLSLGALILLGASDVISVVIRQSLVQMNTPDGMRGRVSAVNSMFVGTSNQLGEFESGVTAAWFGVVPAAFIGGVGTIIVAITWMRLFPQLAHFDTPGKSLLSGESIGK
jgi:MFS family permease